MEDFTVIMYGEYNEACVEMLCVDGRRLVCFEIPAEDIKLTKPYILWGKQVKYALATPKEWTRELTFYDENENVITSFGCRAFFINTWWPPGVNDGERAL